MLKRIVLASLLFCGLGAAPSFAQSNVIVNFKSSATGATQVSPTAGLPVNVVAGSASGCAGTTGTPCFVNVQNWGAGGAALGAMVPYGTSPGAVLVPGVNAYITNVPTVAQATAANLNMTEANSAAILSAVQGSIPAGTAYIGHTSLDPCSYAVKTTYPVLITGTTTVKIVSEVAAQQVYICSVALIASAATVMSIADGTKNSTECDTAAHAIFGQTTATHGMSLAANGGFTVGGGNGTVGSTATAAHDVCIFQSGSGDISGNIVVVQQ